VQTGNIVDSANIGVTFTARIINKTEPISEYGFIWNLVKTNTERSKHYVRTIAGEPPEGYFEQRITTPLVGDRDYTVRAYVKTPSGYSYGRYVTFRASGVNYLNISHYEPDSITWGDTIYIRGGLFGEFKEDVSVMVNRFTFPISFFSDSLIKVTVPSNYTSVKYPLQVNVLNNTWTSSKNIILRPPEIYSIQPDTIGDGYKVTIYGSYFQPPINGLIYTTWIGFNTYTIRDQAIITNNKISFYNHYNLPEGNAAIKVSVCGQEVIYNGILYNSGPRIKSFSPDSGIAGTRVTVKGKFLGTVYDTVVRLGSSNCSLVSINDSILVFRVPFGMLPGSFNLSINASANTTIATQPFTIL
jgi:hypothetical protein